MKSFIIEGGQPLKGSIKPQGAKNEALQILCATLLTSEPIIVNNIPKILDVDRFEEHPLRNALISLFQVSGPVLAATSGRGH